MAYKWESYRPPSPFIPTPMMNTHTHTNIEIIQVHTHTHTIAVHRVEGDLEC